MDDFRDWTGEQLMEAYQRDKDEQVFAELHRRYNKMVCGYLNKLLRRNFADAQDVTQNFWLRIHIACNTYTPGRKVESWFLMIAYNQAIDFMRKHRRYKSWLHLVGHNDVLYAGDVLEDSLHSDVVTVEQELIRKEEAALLRKAMANLSQHHRNALDAVFFQDYKYTEACEWLGIPKGTLKSRLHWAKKSLAKLLQKAA